MIGYCWNKKCHEFNLRTRDFKIGAVHDDTDSRLYCSSCEEPLRIEKFLTEEEKQKKLEKQEKISNLKVGDKVGIFTINEIKWHTSGVAKWVATLKCEFGHISPIHALGNLVDERYLTWNRVLVCDKCKWLKEEEEKMRKVYKISVYGGNCFVHAFNIVGETEKTISYEHRDGSSRHRLKVGDLDKVEKSVATHYVELNPVTVFTKDIYKIKDYIKQCKKMYLSSLNDHIEKLQKISSGVEGLVPKCDGDMSPDLIKRIEGK